MEHFPFFFPRRGVVGWGPILSGKFHYFFLTPSLISSNFFSVILNHPLLFLRVAKWVAGWSTLEIMQTQPSLAGAWAELGKMPFKSKEKDPYHYHIWDFAYFFAQISDLPSLKIFVQTFILKKVWINLHTIWTYVQNMDQSVVFSGASSQIDNIYNQVSF